MAKDSGKKGSVRPKTDQGKYLGDYALSLQRFDNLSSVLRALQAKEFQQLNIKQKGEKVSALLHNLIEKTPTPCFLLPAVIDFIEQVNAHSLIEGYTFLHFELWLNQFSSLSEEQNYAVRAKIMGKKIPRDEYQGLFPIGMGKVYAGSHTVTAHGSPDVDTTVSSFWGWVDAFAARVAKGLHVWNVPGGAPTSQVEIGLLFPHIFGKNVFQALVKTRTTLSISGMELATQKGCAIKPKNASTMTIDHEHAQEAVIIVDEKGYYVGDWHSMDFEGIRQVIMQLNSCLRWLEHRFHTKIISLFSKEKLTLKEIPLFIKELLLVKLSDCQPVQEFSERQKKHLQDYLTHVLQVKKGLEATLEDFAKAMKALSLGEFQAFIESVASLPKSPLFDKSGRLTENRPKIFGTLEKLITTLDKAIFSVRNYVERLDIALKIKAHVFGCSPQYVSVRADVDEIKSKMGNYPYLSVVASDKEGKLIPLGVVHSHDLYKNTLGTVSLRDFCNREETKIPSFFEVISIMDHHKSSLHTSSAPLANIADAQSTNVLCAEEAFAINDRFGTAGMNKQQIETQMTQVSKNLASSQDKRLMKRLLQKQLVLQEKADFYIDPQREFIEYLHFLYGILDDTDLLTKVSKRDLACVAQLINRLKTLLVRKEVEVISLYDIPQDADFLKKAAARILQHPDVYSLYRKIYLAKEKAVEENIALCSKGAASSLFDDTKEQNGCARVGQTKMFPRNYPSFAKHGAAIRRFWYESNLDFYRDRPEVDLYMHMISTVAGAEDVFAGTAEGEYDHSDELWIWIPFTEQSIEHLKEFLNAFRSSPQIMKEGVGIEFYGEKAKDYEQIFNESFLPLPKKLIAGKGALPIAVLKYKAGAINSRKAMISPYLPKLT